MFGRDQQIDVAEHPAAWLVEHELSEPAVRCDPARLLPDRVSRRGGQSADDHISDLSFGMTAHD